MRTIASYTQLLAQRYTRKLDDDGREFLDYVVDAVRRLDELLSNYKPSSELSQVNRSAADHPVVVSQELFDLLRIGLLPVHVHLEVVALSRGVHAGRDGLRAKGPPEHRLARP